MVIGKSVTEQMARDIKSSGGKAPGFGHPVHRPLDPRAERILEMADKRGVSGPHVALARHFRDAVAKAWGKPLGHECLHAHGRRACLIWAFP